MVFLRSIMGMKHYHPLLLSCPPSVDPKPEDREQ